METNLIWPADGGSIALSRDLGEISLWGLYMTLAWRFPYGGALRTAWGPHLEELLLTAAGKNREALSVDVASLLERI
jgi:hypothetical protein